MAAIFVLILYRTLPLEIEKSLNFRRSFSERRHFRRCNFGRLNIGSLSRNTFGRCCEGSTGSSIHLWEVSGGSLSLWE